ncbi:MAG TPA: Type 1 glutamine amidotransferase-like domain-containing protein, partial [Polyangiaceae bacterium]|nr:Type 1 glutamine amidotransferase-like domain-containing protein [Polyangiaceae bacterium]
ASPPDAAPDAGGLTLKVYPRRGSPTDDARAPQGPGLLVGGGGADVDAAFVAAHDLVVGSAARGADVVVLRATGADGYDAYLDGIAAWSSVQTLVVPALATPGDLAFAAAAVEKAELVFFAGGNQADYVAWKGTALMRAVQGVYDRGGVVGGTSAGAAILGPSVNDATLAGAESITSKTMLANPYDPLVHFTQNMLVFPPLARSITDSHFTERDRMGRLAGFMARQIADGVLTGAPVAAYGVAVDEGTTLFIDKRGVGRALRQGATGSAFIVRGGTPDRVLAGQPLVYRDMSVLRLDAPTDSYDFNRRCGVGRGYPLTAVGQGTPPYTTPADPYRAAGAAEACP